jgi:hypothetical protein
MTTADYAEYLAEGELALEPTVLRSRLGDGLAFLIPALQFAQIHAVGTLYATDLLSLAVFLFAFLWSVASLRQRLPRVFLSLGLVWLLAQVMTDLVRSTPFEDYARGWAMIAFTLTNFSALYLLLSQNRRRIILCALGFVAGDIFTFFLAPGVYAAAEPWKFGYGFGVTLLIVLAATLASARSKGSVAVAVMLAAAALNLYEGSRG